MKKEDISVKNYNTFINWCRANLKSTSNNPNIFYIAYYKINFIKFNFNNRLIYYAQIYQQDRLIPSANILFGTKFKYKIHNTYNCYNLNDFIELIYIIKEFGI